MVGIFGMYAFDENWEIARFVYFGILGCQNRGQENAGIATFDSEKLCRFADKGMVEEAFKNDEIFKGLPGWCGIGGVSAFTAENNDFIPPMLSGRGNVAVSMNGKIINCKEIDPQLSEKTHGDMKIVANLLEKSLEKNDSVNAMKEVMEKIKGAYSLVALNKKGDMIIARDPHGIRPLVIGGHGFDLGVISSESAALDVTGSDLSRDVKPGEIFVFEPHSIEKDDQTFKNRNTHYCAFEWVYYARPDSIINDIHVHEVRYKIGELLAKENPVEGADVVIAVPETAFPFAMAYSKVTGIPIDLGFVRTGRHLRTAIKPTQIERIIGVQLKLNPIRNAVRGRKVVLIDDSVVRGSTLRNTVYLLKKRGAKEVHVRIGSPHLIAPCPFGLDVPSQDELIAKHNTEEEIAQIVGADTFAYLSIKGLCKAIGMPQEKLCLGCFQEKYPVYDY